MSITLKDFKNNVADVARPNRFLMNISNAGSVTNLIPPNFQFLVKSASVPPRSIGEVMLNWQGMQHKIAGDPTYDDYQVTVINDINFVARTFFESWINLISNTSTNERSSPDSYMGEIILHHLGRTATEVIASYRMVNIYPKQMDQIDLAYDSNDTPEEFSITFSCDYWEYA